MNKMQFNGLLTLILLFQINFVIGQTNYYYGGSGNGNSTASWWINTNGTGAHPANFTTANQIFNVQSGQTLPFSSTLTISGTSSKLVVKTGGVVTSGAFNHSLTLDMESGATWTQQNSTYGALVFGSINSNSNWRVENTSGFSTRTYPNFIIGGNINFNAASVSLTAQGNLIIDSGSEFRGTGNSSAPTHNISGDIIINGTLNLTNGTGTPTYNVSGTITNSGTISSAGSGLPTINFTGSNSVTVTWGTQTTSNFNVNIASTKTVALGSALSIGSGRTVTVNGRLDCGTNNITGAGAFTLTSGGTLGIGSTNGITSSGASGNIQVTGTRTFPGGGNYEYNGSSAQSTGTGLPTPLSGTLFINNSNGVSLTNATTISGTLNFQSGTLLSNNNTLTLSGTVSNASSSSFVCTCTTSGPATSGGVTRTVTTSGFLFPVGPSTSSYMPATIATSSGSAPFTVRVLNLANANNASAAVQRMWNITGSGTASLTLQWNASEEGGSFDPSGALRIGRYTGGTPSWVEVSASYNAGGPSATASISAWGTNFGVGTASSLPIKLISFSATRQNNQAQLTFSTATEENNNFFAIERSSNGTDFRTIGKVNGAGTTTSIQNYTFTDETPLSGINYYRLKQVDFDGQFTYSPVVNVVFDNKAGIRLAPTPVQDQLRVELDEMFQEDAQWQLYDFAGRLVQTGVLSAENMVFNVEVGSLTPGNYVIRVVSGQTTLTKQFQK
jgi:hypothetical protein